MEYWIVYDLVSGIERYRGAGSEGLAAVQALPEGAGIVLVPPDAVRGAEVDLEIIRAAVVAQIDAQAEMARQGVLTPGAGQALTYQRKEAEARAWFAEKKAATPFLSAEAEARGMTIFALASEVIRNADAWTTIGAAIEGMRMGAKAAVAAAQTLGAIVDASKVKWATLTDRGAA
jgi:hypothetical protein